MYINHVYRLDVVNTSISLGSLDTKIIGQPTKVNNFTLIQQKEEAPKVNQSHHELKLKWTSTKLRLVDVPIVIL